MGTDKEVDVSLFMAFVECRVNAKSDRNRADHDANQFPGGIDRSHPVGARSQTLARCQESPLIEYRFLDAPMT
jgi:hypothetical protein